MKAKKSSFSSTLPLLPSFGIGLFVLLYLFASTLYPGGSQMDAQSSGFDWVHNYWCNLTSQVTVNGALNPARPYAIAALFLLCASLGFFFVQFAQRFVDHQAWKRASQWGGILSMIFSSLIFTEYHDLMTILASIFGLFVVLGIIRSILQSDLRAYKIGGSLGIFLLVANNYIYYTQHFLVALPLLQKITFAFILAWIMGLNVEIYRKSS